LELAKGWKPDGEDPGHGTLKLEALLEWSYTAITHLAYSDIDHANQWNHMHKIH